MPQYTTGEMAKQCGVSVRTVQYYDTKDLLKPSELTEGGRRLYSDSDLKQLRLICLLKSLGLSLDAIKGILQSDAPYKTLTLFLDEEKKQVKSEIKAKKKILDAIETVQTDVTAAHTIPENLTRGIDHIMEGNKKLRRTRMLLLAVGIPLDIIEIGTLIFWIVTGIWWPFALGMAVVIAGAVLLIQTYYHNTAYICPECGKIFRPHLREFIFSNHTPKTRKLTCAVCGKKSWCVETGNSAETEGTDK